MTDRPTRRLCLLALGSIACACLSGCGGDDESVETGYGRSRDASVNGTGAFAEWLRAQGHEVRAAIRLDDEVAGWANVMVRFAGEPGLPREAEGARLLDWVKARPGRKLVYIPRDVDAEVDYWAAILAELPKDADPARKARIEARKAGAERRSAPLDDAFEAAEEGESDERADPKDWFVLEPRNPPEAPTTCQALDGPWAEGVDAKAAAIRRRQAFRPEPDEPVLLRGDGMPLAISRDYPGGGQVLALANASFLLNASLLVPARRPLAARVVDWIGAESGNVAFVEGLRPVGGPKPPNLSGRLLRTFPFGWAILQFAAFLLILAFAHAVRLGRPLPEPPSGVEKPSAHPEALGALWAKRADPEAARTLLDAYRRWRHAPKGPGRKS